MYFQEIDDGLDPMQKEAIRSYLNRPDVMVLVKLRCNVTGQILTVGNIHVHWGKMKVPDVQCIQVSHKYPNGTFWRGNGMLLFFGGGNGICWIVMEVLMYIRDARCYGLPFIFDSS